MLKIKRLILLMFSMVLMIMVLPVMAQGDEESTEDCPNLFAETITAVQVACPEVDAGQTCYGSPEVSATFADDATPTFDVPGDIVNTVDIATLTLSESTEGTWGAVLMQEDTYSAVLFGDASYDVEAQTFTPSEDSTCENAGMAFQAEESSTVTINGVEIVFDGSVLVTSTSDGETEISVLIGTAEITASDGTSTSVDVGMVFAVASDGTTSIEPEPVSGDALEISYFLIYAGISPRAGGAENYPLPELSSTPITPLSGTWEMVRYSNYIYAGCSTGLMGSFEERVDQTPPETFATFDFSDGVSIPSFLEQQTGNPPPEALFIQPAPNWYHAIATPPIEFALYIVSETEIWAQTIWGDQEYDCLRIGFNYWEYRE